MGRNRIDKDKMKQKISVSIDPELIIILKEKFINISSLMNNLLKNYIENGNKNM